MLKMLLLILALIGTFSGIQTAPDTPTTLFIVFEEEAKTKPDVDVSGIALYDLGTDGKYTKREDYITTAEWPYYFIMDKSGNFIYSLEENDKEGNLFNLTVYVKDSNTGNFSYKDTSDTTCDLYYLAIDDTQKYLATADFANGTVLLYSLNDDGTYNLEHSVEVTETSKTKTAYPMKVGFHSIQKDLVGVANAGLDTVSFFKLTADKKLEKTGFEAVLTNGSFPANFIFAKDGKMLYVIGLKSAKVVVFNVTTDETTKEILSFQKAQEIESLPAGESGTAGKYDYFIDEGGDARVLIHPNGTYLYAMHVHKNYVAVYQIDKTNGQLATPEFYKFEGDCSFGMVLSPNGKSLLISNDESNNVVIFNISDVDGKLTQATTGFNLGGAGYMMYPGQNM